MRRSSNRGAPSCGGVPESRSPARVVLRAARGAGRTAVGRGGGGSRGPGGASGTRGGRSGDGRVRRGVPSDARGARGSVVYAWCTSPDSAQTAARRDGLPVPSLDRLHRFLEGVGEERPMFQVGASARLPAGAGPASLGSAALAPAVRGVPLRRIVGGRRQGGCGARCRSRDGSGNRDRRRSPRAPGGPHRHRVPIAAARRAWGPRGEPFVGSRTRPKTLRWLQCVRSAAHPAPRRSGAAPRCGRRASRAKRLPGGPPGG